MRLVALIRRVGFAICAPVGLVVLLVSLTPFVSWYSRVLAGPWNDPEGAILIVLGGGEFDEGFPAENSTWRGIYAYRSWKTGRFQRIVISGSRVSGDMRELLLCKGVPPDAVVTENASLSTRENAMNTAHLLAGESGSKVLLTSDYHMFRASRAFRKAGLKILPRPIPDAGKRATSVLRRWPAFLDEVVETAKIGYYAMRGWI